MQSIAESTGNQFGLFESMKKKWFTDLRVAVPGIIQSFDPAEQTVTVQPAIKEHVADGEGNVTEMALPLLLDVPIVFPKSGGFVLTMPINAGDECLVVFSDMCIDGWWAHGDIQIQEEIRRHDLSDAFAILGPCSQVKKLSNYNNNACELRTTDGSQCIEITQSHINLKGTILKNGVAL